MTRRAWKILITVTIVAGGVAFLAYQSLGDSTDYVHVEEVTASPTRYLDKQILVHGFARKVPDKGRIEGQTIVWEFELESQGEVIWVTHTGTVPDVFKNQAETVVRGTLHQEGGRLVLTTVGGEKGIMAKCASKYEKKRKP